MRSSFQFIIDPFAARAATTGPTFVTVSALYLPANDTPWELFFTMQNKQTDIHLAELTPKDFPRRKPQAGVRTVWVALREYQS